MGVPLRLSARERWLLLPGPSLLSSSFLELSSLLRVEGTLAISSLPTARGSSSRKLEMRLTMGRVTPASTSNTNGKRQDTRAMPGLTSSRVGARRWTRCTRRCWRNRGCRRRGRSTRSCTRRPRSKSHEEESPIKEASLELLLDALELGLGHLGPLHGPLELSL